MQSLGRTTLNLRMDLIGAYGAEFALQVLTSVARPLLRHVTRVCR